MKNIIDKFMELLKESTITQSMLVFLVFAPVAYRVTIGASIPEQVTIWGSIIIGFFFGAKSAYQIMKRG